MFSLRRLLSLWTCGGLMGLATLALCPRQAHAIGEVGTLTLGGGENNAVSAVIDSSNTYAYFGMYTSSGIVSKIRLSDFTEFASIQLSTAESYLTSAIISTTTNTNQSFAYFGTFTNPAQVVEISQSSFTQISTATFITQASSASCAVIDPQGVYGYFGSWTSPGMVTKVHLPDMTVVSTVTLQVGENFLSAAVIDSGTFAYFGTATSPGKIVKINLNTFTEQSTLNLGSGDNGVASGVINSTFSFAYFGLDTAPGRVVQINLQTFTEKTSLPLTGGGEFLTSAVIDSTGTNAYFGSNSSPGLVTRVVLGTMVEGPTVTLKSGENFLTAAIIDNSNGYTYFGTNTAPAEIIKIDILDSRTGPPIITSQPNSPTVNPGEIATFVVGAIGSQPLSYQWNLNGSPISGANSATYETPPVTLADDGSQFSCTVSNSLGSATSNPGTLTVKPVIRVYPNPWRVDRYAGTPITFDHLAPNSTIKIFTTSMHWVKTLSTNTGSVTWDLTNDSGEKVASGYYFYLVKTGRDEQTTHGKIAIIQ